MVISKILAFLRDSKRIKIDAIVGVHIDYANRPESSREATYVKEWCDSLGLIYRVRVINEVTRGITDRDAYEKIARNIRYSFYEECIQEALQGAFLPTSQQSVDTTSSSNSSSSTIQKEDDMIPIEIRVSGMMFGHHLGDVQENLISNVMRSVSFLYTILEISHPIYFRGCSPLYLSGMTETSLTNHVIVWRPLLSQVKEDIYHFAHQYGVPYFKDSTPSWSTRGKLRNQLIPLLKEIYGEGCLMNLSHLAHESDEMRTLVNSNLYDPFLQ
jgi:tRNA(Ile)-lysidine synthase TilS/MesJ